MLSYDTGQKGPGLHPARRRWGRLRACRRSRNWTPVLLRGFIFSIYQTIRTLHYTEAIDLMKEEEKIGNLFLALKKCIDKKRKKENIKIKKKIKMKNHDIFLLINCLFNKL